MTVFRNSLIFEDSHLRKSSMEIVFLEKDTLIDLFLQVGVGYTNGNARKLAFVYGS
jgi:hypothetical protein